MSVPGCILRVSLKYGFNGDKIMAKYLDKTKSEWDELTERWHSDSSIKCSLQEYLNLNDIEYLKFVHGIDEQNITDEDIIQKSSEIAQNVITELVIKPAFDKAVQFIGTR